MKNVIKNSLVVLIFPVMSGCYSIGIETVSQEKFGTAFLSINGKEIRESEDGGTVRIYDPTNGNYFVFPQIRFDGISSNAISRSYGNTSYEYYDGKKAPPKIEGLNYGTPVDDAKSIIGILGVPDKQSATSLRYNNDKRSWKGFAIDLAIFPIPLTIPLMLPGDKDGYAEFQLDDNGNIYLLRYGNTSKLYGFWGDDSGCGSSKGTQPGFFWFNR